MYTTRQKALCEIKLLRVLISSITRHCFLFSMNCPAKLISKAFFSRLVRSSKGGRLTREEDSSQVYGVKKERKPCTSFRNDATFYIGKREVELDEDKGNARDRKRKIGKGWKMKKKNESA